MTFSGKNQNLGETLVLWSLQLLHIGNKRIITKHKSRRFFLTNLWVFRALLGPLVTANRQIGN